MEQVRMVVTGHDENGRSRFVRDEVVSAISIGGQGEFATLWASNTPATYPNGGQNPSEDGMFPPVGGVRFHYVSTLPNEGEVNTPEAFGSYAKGVVSDEGWHRTDSTDFVFILSGQTALETDSGVTILSAGDVVVQNGTRHRWSVVGDEPVLTLVFTIGAHRS